MTTHPHARTTTSGRSIAPWPRRRVAAVALALVAATAAGCAGDATTDGTSMDGAPAGPDAAGDVLELGTLSAPDLRPDGVLIAAVLLAAGGDVEEAVADGLVTPTEVDTAAAALADGTLAAWAAEAGLPAG